jgi:hypothetical protein
VRRCRRSDCRLDPLLIDKPADLLGAVGAKIEAISDPFKHALRSEHFGLADCRGRVNIDDDRVLGVDEILGRVCEESLPAVRTSPARRGVGGRDELGRDLGRGPESCIVENGQILLDRSARCFGRKPVVALDSLLPIGIGPDQACVDGEAFTADKWSVDVSS